MLILCKVVLMMSPSTQALVFPSTLTRPSFQPKTSCWKKSLLMYMLLQKKTRLGPVDDPCSDVCQPAISRWRPSENHLPRTCWSGDGIGDKASMREQKKRPVWRSSASMTTLPFFGGGAGTIAAVPLDPREPPFICLLELAIWIFFHIHMCEWIFATTHVWMIWSRICTYILEFIRKYPNVSEWTGFQCFCLWIICTGQIVSMRLAEG